MYGFDESTNTSSGGSKIQAGITENVLLKDVTYDHLKTDGTGQKVLRFVFADSNGATFTHIEFPIDYDSRLQAAKGWSKSKDDAERYVKQEFQSQGERIKHILSCYIPKDKCVFHAQTFEEFANGIIKLLGQTYNNVPVRIKTIYKKNSAYTTFPKRAVAPFIQNMSEVSRLTINPEWDNVTPPVPDTVESHTSVFDSTASAELDSAPW